MERSSNPFPKEKPNCFFFLIKNLIFQSNDGLFREGANTNVINAVLILVIKVAFEIHIGVKRRKTVFSFSSSEP